MLRRGVPEEPEWYRTATRSIALAEEEARTDSRQRVLAQQQAYEAQQQAAAQALAAQQAAQHQAHQAYAQQQAQQYAQHQAWLQQQQYTAHYVTAQAQANPTPRPTLRTWLLAGVVGVCSLGLLLIFALMYGFSFGIVLTLVSLLAALIPLTIVIPIFLWLDRFEAEPWRYLLTAFLYGALGSTFLAMIGNGVVGSILGAMFGAQNQDVLTAVIAAPLVEETTKGVFLLVMWWFMRREFNGLTDGIVYAGIVAAGFAFTENIQYFAGAAMEQGVAGFGVTFVLRGIVTPFLHPMFTTMTGIGVGLAAVSRSMPVKFVAPVLGWCAGVLLHGLWNLSASTGTAGLFIGLGVGFVAFCAFISFVVWTRKREGRVIGQHLMAYVDTGWISGEEVGMLASMKSRRAARRWAKYHRGPQGLQSMRSFQDCASELALLRFRQLSHVAEPKALERERVLLDSMTARRREFAGAAPAMV
ncbi:PrsW family intramembrane metalloprotease [Janibacter anophelis]|uniref:PrsW family intramembrane metalloprotease n=1 Tax=Janibacter anophelis TaxID=319054 RepID=UPI003F802869